MRPRVGLDMLYYAILAQDDSGGTAYDTPVAIPNVTNIGLNFNAEFSTFFADDGPREAFSQIGEVDVNLTVADLNGQQVADLIGASYNDATGLVNYSVTAVAPEVAIGFRAQKTNGEYRYMWLLKGTFGVPDSEFQTKEGSITFQPQSITGRFMARTYDDMVFRRLDSDDENFAFPNLPTSWFTDPDLGAEPTALAVSTISPDSGATAVDLDSTIDITFDADVRAADVNTDNFTLYDADAGSYVTCAVGLDPALDDKVIVTPSADMAASSLHVVTIKDSVRNVSGGKLGEDYISTFTTA